MNIMAMIIGAIAPGICLLWYFYLKDKDQPEPLRLILSMFILGGLVVFPLMVVQNAINPVFQGIWVQSYLVSGFSEEFIKWFLVVVFIYKHNQFDEHFDGIVYTVAAAAGFATVENVLYSFIEKGSLIQLLWSRAFLPVSAHVLFGVVMGYFLGLAKTTGSKTYIALSLFVPILLHGTFNQLIYSSKLHGSLFIIGFMVFLWFYAVRKMNHALRLKKRVPIASFVE